MGLHRHGRDLLKGQHGALLGGQGVIGVLADRGGHPRAVVEVGLLKAHLGGAAVVPLQKLGLVAADTHLGKARVGGHGKALVAGQESLPVHHQIADEAVALIAALPDAVDEALVEGMDGDDVLPRGQVGGQIHLVVVVLEMVGGGRALGDEAAVDVELVVIVGGQKDPCLPKILRHGEAAAEKDVAVPMLTAIQGEGSELLVEHVAGGEISQRGIGDPRTEEGVCHVRCSFRLLCWGETVRRAGDQFSRLVPTRMMSPGVTSKGTLAQKVIWGWGMLALMRPWVSYSSPT